MSQSPLTKVHKKKLDTKLISLVEGELIGELGKGMKVGPAGHKLSWARGTLLCTLATSVSLFPYPENRSTVPIKATVLRFK